MKAVCKKCGYTYLAHEKGVAECDSYDGPPRPTRPPVVPGEIVLINTDPEYGEWHEAVVIDVVESVVVKIYDHNSPLTEVIADPDGDHEEIIVPLKKIVKLPKEET